MRWKLSTESTDEEAGVDGASDDRAAAAYV
jgi:hypothetical protein